jgi:hypothetical protein
MNRDRVTQLRPLEGHRVTVALRDGSRIDDCQLISSGRNWARTVWLFTTGSDTFVSLDDIVELWETSSGPPRPGRWS